MPKCNATSHMGITSPHMTIQYSILGAYIMEFEDLGYISPITYSFTISKNLNEVFGTFQHLVSAHQKIKVIFYNITKGNKTA